MKVVKIEKKRNLIPKYLSLCVYEVIFFNFLVIKYSILIL